MISNIKKFFEEFMTPGEGSADPDNDHDIQFATAALLMEVTRSDNDVSEVEKDAVLAILNNLFEFTAAEVMSLMELAEDASDEAHDLYSFTRLINDNYEYQSKKQLVRNLWDVAYADGRLDEFEEHIVRRISGLIHVSNHDFIRAKIAARDAQG